MSVYTGSTVPQHSDNEVTLYRKIAASLNANSSWLFTPVIPAGVLLDENGLMYENENGTPVGLP